jgi:beta-mannosidase
MRSTVYWILAGCQAAAIAPAAQVWTVRVEEPTGIERRDGELARVPLSRIGNSRDGFRVVDARGRELPWQADGANLLFPVTLIGGQMAEYRVWCCQPQAARLKPEVSVRKLPSGRIELANSRLRVLVEGATGRIVEAYNLSAAPHRVLNLVETTPDEKDPNDIHADDPLPPGPKSPVSGPNEGWSDMGPALPVSVIEAGPLLARIGGAGWSMEIEAGSPRLLWRGRNGFRFAGISAQPHLPYDRFVHGGEYDWPTGPGSGEPPDHHIASRPWRQPPGGSFVYYARRENYGALTFVALDEALSWSGAGTFRFEGRSTSDSSILAVLFSRWRGDETALEARADARRSREPVLVQVDAPTESGIEVASRLEPLPAQTVDTQAALPAEWRRPEFSLDGEWELAWGEKGAGPRPEWRKVKVPGSAHLQWLPPGDVYSRGAAWVSRKDWWYRKRFTLPASLRGERIRLEFDATDYYAEAFLDGKRLGRHEGYIDPSSYDVTALVKPGAEHELLVRVWTPVHYYWKHRPYTVKGSYGGVDQKPDDITALGITRSVRLAAYSRARISGVATSPLIRNEREAVLSIDLESEGDLAGLHWEATLAPATFEGPAVTVRAGASAGRIEIPVANPRLWWTWDLGRPDLYWLDVRLKSAAGETADARRIRIGLREIRRQGWQFFLNGKRIFLRGTNVYANLWLSEMTREKYAADLDIIGKMNVNLIRVHCHFENPEFYDLTDERGILVWQDFLEAWYPHDPDFSPHAAALFDNHIRYVRNHASIAVWAPSDEESLENYFDLSKHLAARASLLDPQNRWVQRSTGRWGDAHLYHGWYGGAIWDYARMEENLITELGATALPAKESLDRFLAGKWPIAAHAEDWKYRRLQLSEARQAWGDLGGSQSPEQLIAKSQDYAARLFQIAIERTRRRKPEGAGGIFHFFAIDFWPSVTMAAVDFYRKPTKVWTVVGRSFEPVLASIEYDRDVWKRGEEMKAALWAINDTYQTLENAEIRWRILGEQGRTVAEGRLPVSIQPDSSMRVGEVKWPAAHAGDYRLEAAVTWGGRPVSQNQYEFRVAP